MDWNQMHRGRWNAADTRLWTAFGHEASDFAEELISNDEYVRRLAFFAKYTNPYLTLVPRETISFAEVRGCSAGSECSPGARPQFNFETNIRYGMFDPQPALSHVTATMVEASTFAPCIDLAALALGIDASTNAGVISRLMLTMGHVATLSLVEEVCEHSHTTMFARRERPNSAPDNDFYFFFKDRGEGLAMGRAWCRPGDRAWNIRSERPCSRFTNWWRKDDANSPMNVLLCNWEPPFLTEE